MTEKLSTLQIAEGAAYEELSDVETPRDGGIVLTELGVIHLRMGETRRGLKEIYTGLRGLEPAERATVVCMTLGYIAGAAYSPDYATLEHADALRRQARERRAAAQE